MRPTYRKRSLWNEEGQWEVNFLAQWLSLTGIRCLSGGKEAAWEQGASHGLVKGCWRVEWARAVRGAPVTCEEEAQSAGSGLPFLEQLVPIPRRGTSSSPCPAPCYSTLLRQNSAQHIPVMCRPRKREDRAPPTWGPTVNKGLLECDWCCRRGLTLFLGPGRSLAKALKAWWLRAWQRGGTVWIQPCSTLACGGGVRKQHWEEQRDISVLRSVCQEVVT